MLGVRVPKASAESLRKEISSARLLDKTHFITEDDSFVLIPVTGRPDPEVLSRHSAEVVERGFVDRDSTIDPIDQIRGIVQMPSELRPLLPSGWEKLGTVAVIRLDARLDKYEKEIAEAYASVLKLDAVLRDIGGISGEFREPVTRLLLGTNTVTTHLENGIRYRLDVAKIMFSSGNMEERLRMATVQCDGEIVVDMFAGIGYFSLPIAVHQRPRQVISCELNPVAHSYLCENISLNHVEDRIKPVLGDNRNLEGEAFADRVIMGYVKTTHEHLPTAIRLLKDGGILHYHETCPNELLPGRPLQRMTEAAKGMRIHVLRSKEIKSYAPGVSHVVVDARVFKRA